MHFPVLPHRPGKAVALLKNAQYVPGELISYAEWDNQKSIDRYLASADHQEIKKHARGLKSEQAALVKCYELV